MDSNDGKHANDTIKIINNFVGLTNNPKISEIKSNSVFKKLFSLDLLSKHDNGWTIDNSNKTDVTNEETMTKEMNHNVNQRILCIKILYKKRRFLDKFWVT